MGNKSYILNPEAIAKEAEKKGITKSELLIPPLIIFTFNQAIINELKQKCNLEKWKWAGEQFVPYSPIIDSWKGFLDGYELLVVIPPMGASPLAALTEEMIYFGAKIIFLVCASWSLGADILEKGEIHLPTYATGLDGTSLHYGNWKNYIEAESSACKALIEALNESGVKWKKGGVASCEAIYRITPFLVDYYKKQGCLSMENGEAATLFSIAKIYSIPIGILFQPYIDLSLGWDLSYLDEDYLKTGKTQALIVLQAAKKLLKKSQI